MALGKKKGDGNAKTPRLVEKRAVRAASNDYRRSEGGRGNISFGEVGSAEPKRKRNVLTKGGARKKIRNWCRALNKGSWEFRVPKKNREKTGVGCSSTGVRGSEGKKDDAILVLDRLVECSRASVASGYEDSDRMLRRSEGKNGTRAPPRAFLERGEKEREWAFRGKGAGCKSRRKGESGTYEQQKRNTK